ncbi:MAG: hypothetical protein FJ100_20565 [Deltaproteobacteria bacterium]|nr:hypothetical protein [Deltaproteobacteria bacterium]
MNHLMFVAVVVLCALPGCGCRKDVPQAADAAGAAQRIAPVPTAHAALPAVESPAAAEMADAASPAEPPAPPTPPTAPAPSVAMFLDAGTGQPADLPTAGKPVKLTVTPINEKGQAIADRDPVLGAEVAIVAVRFDLSWRQVLRADKLSDPARHTHTFKLTFAKAGHHLLYFLFRPKGRPLAAVPIAVTVQGQVPPGEEWPDHQLEYSEGGVRVALRTSTEELKPCDPFHVATVWTRKGEPLPLQGPEGESKVLYLALAESLGTPSMGKPALTSVESLGGDTDTHATLTLLGRGHYKVMAVADTGTAKAPQLTIAWFAVTAKGTVPEGGCPMP